MPLGGPPYLVTRAAALIAKPAPTSDLLPGVAYPIVAMPEAMRADPEGQVLLYCGPDEGGWRLGVFHDGCWRDFTDLDRRLAPSHFSPVPRDPI